VRACALVWLPPTVVGTAGSCNRGSVDSSGSRLTEKPCTGSPAHERGHRHSQSHLQRHRGRTSNNGSTHPAPYPRPPRSLTLPPCPPVHPHQAAAERSATQLATRAPSPPACISRPPNWPARLSPQVSHTLSNNEDTTRRPPYRPKLPTGRGGHPCARWPPSVGATTEARGRWCYWPHNPFTSRRPPAGMRLSVATSLVLCVCHNYRCSAFAV